MPILLFTKIQSKVLWTHSKNKIYCKKIMLTAEDPKGFDHDNRRKMNRHHPGLLG